VLTLQIHANTVRALSLFEGAAACIFLGCGCFGASGLLLVSASLGRTFVCLIERIAGAQSDAGRLFDATVARYEEFFAFGGLAFFFRSSSAAFAITLVALIGLLLISYGEAKAEALRVALPASAPGRIQRTAGCIGAALTPMLSTILRRWGGLSSSTANSPAILVLMLLAVAANVMAIRRLRVIAALAGAKTADDARGEDKLPAADGLNQIHSRAMDACQSDYVLLPPVVKSREGTK
jgi:CDP-diacylglycerol--glycerol-3-phosphate 3-phosphatidyltransferase